MPITPLDVQNKVDNPAKLAELNAAGTPTEQYIKATEFNAVKNKVNETVTTINTIEATANSAAAAAAGKVDKTASAELEVTSDIQVNDLNPQGKGLFRFNNPITITGIDTSGFYDGQQIELYNASSGVLILAHNSTESSSVNRLYISSGKDIGVLAKHVAFFIWRKSVNRLEQVYVSSAALSLANASGELRVVTVGPDGTLYSEAIIDYMIYDDTTVPYASLALLVAAYPSANGYKKGFTVICRNLNPPLYYRKDTDGDEAWTMHQGTKMT